MIDLGKYAETVLSAYAITLVLLAAIILITWRKSAQAKRRLQEIEARENG